MVSSVSGNGADKGGVYNLYKYLIDFRFLTIFPLGLYNDLQVGWDLVIINGRPNCPLGESAESVDNI